MIGLLLLAAVPFFGDPELDAALDKAPPEVRAFVVRLGSCEHWAGEEPYDADRRREIEHALRVGRCDRVDADEAVLRRRYAGRPDILKLFDAATTAE